MARADALPGGPAKDQAMQQIIGRVAETVEGKLSRADKIDSKERRTKALKRIVDATPEVSMIDISRRSRNETGATD
jgi:hypothetical protein